jgi:hypothetical protein
VTISEEEVENGQENGLDARVAVFLTFFRKSPTEKNLKTVRKTGKRPKVRFC